MNKDFSDLSRNELWSDIKTLKRKKGITDKIDYSTQYKTVYKAFDVCGIDSQRKIRWNTKSMESNYSDKPV